MKRMMFLGALVLGVTVCTQSFGFELLNRMLGHHGCASCCEPACDAGAACCEPACDAGNGCSEPACDAGAGCCEPACGAASCCGGRKCDLFGGVKGLFERCRAKHRGCCDSCCEPACDAGTACCEPACDAGNGCCEPSCGAAGCCGVRKCGTPIRDMLRAIHAAKKARHGCCGSCCEPGCGAEPACGCEPACGAVQEAVPAAPTPDASAATKTPAKQVVALK